MRILIKDVADGGWRQIELSSYSDEADLQVLIAGSPGIIPVDEIREGMLPFSFAVREYGLPGSGNTDLLLFNAEGDIGLVECKLASNAEIKRKVIGQILEYAAYLWNASYEEIDEVVARKTGKSLSLNIGGSKRPDGWAEDQFRQSLSQTLANGTFNLIIAVDRMNEELDKTISYLNECGNSAFTFHALELNRYRSDRDEMLVPKLHGQIPQTKQADRSRRRIWTEVDFLERLQSSTSELVFQSAADLHSWSKATADRVYYGTGKSKGSFTFHFLPEGRTLSVFSIYTDGIMTINYGYLSRQAGPSEVEAFHSQLHQRPSFSVLQYREGGFPSIDIAGLSTDDIGSFKTIVLLAFGKYSEKLHAKQ